MALQRQDAFDVPARPDDDGSRVALGGILDVSEVLAPLGEQLVERLGDAVLAGNTILAGNVVMAGDHRRQPETPGGAPGEVERTRLSGPVLAAGDRRDPPGRVGRGERQAAASRQLPGRGQQPVQGVQSPSGLGGDIAHAVRSDHGRPFPAWRYRADPFTSPRIRSAARSAIARTVAFGWAFVICIAIFLAAHGKDYYSAPAYTIVLAAGALATERILESLQRANLRAILKPICFALPVIGIALLLPLVLPVLPLVFPGSGPGHPRIAWCNTQR